MNRCENVCPDCPLRTKVNLPRAREAHRWRGYDAVDVTLYDGNNRYTVSLLQKRDPDSGIGWDVGEDIEQTVDNCNGPTGLLKKKCGAGLASAWRWEKSQRLMQPNVFCKEDILPLLGDATYRDALPYSDQSVWLLGDPREFSEYKTDIWSSFTNVAIKKLTRTVEGTAATLPKNKAVILDEVPWGAYQGTYRIRVAQGGPQFAFREEWPQDVIPQDVKRGETKKEGNSLLIVAEGIYKFIHATPEELIASTELIREINRQDEEARQRFRNSWL